MFGDSEKSFGQTINRPRKINFFLIAAIFFKDFYRG
jgi:hypothetical protein